MDTTQVAQATGSIHSIMSYVLPAATTLVSVVVSASVARWVAMKQIRASVVSKARLEWTDALRNDAAEYLVSITNVIRAWETPEGKDNLQKVHLAGERMLLRLDPADPDEAKLVEAIRAFVKEAERIRQDWKKAGAERFGELAGQFRSLLQSILNRERQKVRRGE